MLLLKSQKNWVAVKLLLHDNGGVIFLLPFTNLNNSLYQKNFDRVSSTYHEVLFLSCLLKYLSFFSRSALLARAQTTLGGHLKTMVSDLRVVFLLVFSEEASFLRIFINIDDLDKDLLPNRQNILNITYTNHFRSLRYRSSPSHPTLVHKSAVRLNSVMVRFLSQFSY